MLVGSVSRSMSDRLQHLRLHRLKIFLRQVKAPKPPLARLHVRSITLSWTGVGMIKNSRVSETGYLDYETG